MKIRVGVIFGGESVEHEVSIISAVQAMYKIDTEKYEVIPLYITKDRKWYTGEILKDMDTYQDMDLLKRYTKEVVLYEKDGHFVLQTKGIFKKIVKEVDIVFPIVHGTNVEDGTLQGYLQSIGVPYVGVDVYSAVVGQDKVFMKDIFKQNDINVPEYVWFYDTEYEEDRESILEKITSKLKFPVIVKPATLGSSVGIEKADNKEELIDAIDDAIKYDKKIIVEKLVKNLVEVNISVVGNYEIQSLSAIEKVMATKDILTYQDKYLGSSKTKGKISGGIKSKGMASTDRIIPARIDEKMAKEVSELAKKVFRSLNLSGICRVDFLIDKKTKKVYVNEPNTIPGSLAFYLWEPINKEYDELLDEAITLAIKEYKNMETKTSSFETNILSNFGGTKGLKGSKGKLRN